MHGVPEQVPGTNFEELIPASQDEVDHLGPSEPWPDPTIVQQSVYETAYWAARHHWENSELKLRANHDELTGALNRWGLRNEYSGVERRGGASGEDSYVLLIDVDNFSTVNNTHGHPAGDVVLKKLVTIMRANVRETDIAARLGGDEFALILPSITAERAREIARIILAEVERSAPTTVSIGIGKASILASLDDTISRVDQALYKAKNNGGNQIAEADEVGHDPMTA